MANNQTAVPETGTLSVPEGMKCVPTKPTEAVIEAMRRCVTEDGETCNTSGYSAMYQAAIKAAPTLPYAVSAIGQRTELTGGGSASLNGWPGNRGTAPQGVQECRENSGAADGGERPAPLSTTQERKA